jgi:hypothetical protein
MGDGSPDYFLVSKGARVLQADLLSRAFTGPSILERLLPPEEIPATISGYPIEGMIGYPAGEMIFPDGLAQRQGTCELVGEDRVTGRAALIIGSTPQPTGPIVDRFHIDVLDGVLLRHQVLDTTGGSKRVESDVAVTRVVYDPEFAPGLFRLEIPEGLCFQKGPEWSVIGDRLDRPVTDHRVGDSDR